MTKTKKNETDVLFAAYAQTAPLGDLRFYLRYAEKKLAVLDYPEQTIRVMAEMTALDREIANIPGTPTLKRRVWTLIDRFKASIPEWYGHAGAADTWVEDIASARFYFQVQAQTVVITQTRTQPNAEGVDETSEVEERAEGPVPIEVIAERHLEASRRANELNHRFVKPRADVLTPEQVQALIAAAMPTTALDVENVPKPVRKPKSPAMPALTCPSCSAPLLPVALCANTWACASCKESWHLEPVRKVAKQRAPRPVVVREPRGRPEIAAEGQKQCTTCSTYQDLEQFTWGDGGRTVRNMCRTCRKQQQAARRNVAA